MAEQTALPGLQQKLTAEVLGTFVLVFFGCGSVLYAGQIDAPTTITTTESTPTTQLYLLRRRGGSTSAIGSTTGVATLRGRGAGSGLGDGAASITTSPDGSGAAAAAARVSPVGSGAAKTGARRARAPL